MFTQFPGLSQPPVPGGDFVNVRQWADAVQRMQVMGGSHELQQQVHQQISEQWRVLQRLSQWIQDASSQLSMLAMTLQPPAMAAFPEFTPPPSSEASADEAPGPPRMQQPAQQQFQQRQPFRFNPQAAARTRPPAHMSSQTIALRARAEQDVVDAATKKRAVPIRGIIRPATDPMQGQRRHVTGLETAQSASEPPKLPAQAAIPLSYAEIPPTQTEVPPTQAAIPLAQTEMPSAHTAIPPAHTEIPLPYAEIPLAQTEIPSAHTAIPPLTAPIVRPAEPAVQPAVERAQSETRVRQSGDIPPAPPLPGALKPMESKAAAPGNFPAPSAGRTGHGTGAKHDTERAHHRFGIARETCPACAGLSRRVAEEATAEPGGATTVLQLARLFDKQAAGLG